MNKIKIHFHVNTFRYGGLEKILLVYLINLDRNHYEISLTIGRFMFDLERLKENIPSDIAVSYLIPEKWINVIQYKKNKQLPLSRIERIFHNLISSPLSRILYKKRMKQATLNKDVVIDFDLHSEDIVTDAPIVSVLHFSLMSFIDWKIDKNARSYKRMYDKFAKHDKFIVLNHDTLQECCDVFYEFKNKYHVIYNPFDINNILEMSNEGFSDLYGDYIVSVCRLEESQKDVTTLIKAFDLIVNKYNYSGSLVLVGDGNSRSELELLVSQLGLMHRVFFVGIQNNPFKFMKNSQMLILSSKFEGFGNVIVESLITETVVIASDCPTGPREILNNGEYGYLFDVGDYEQLAFLANKLLSSPEESELLRQKSMLRGNDFSVSSALSKFYALVDDVIKDK